MGLASFNLKRRMANEGIDSGLLQRASASSDFEKAKRVAKEVTDLKRRGTLHVKPLKSQLLEWADIFNIAVTEDMTKKEIAAKF